MAPADYSPNLRAFLTTLTVSELTQKVIDQSDHGFDVLVGSTPAKVNRFASYADHPRVRVWLPKISTCSTGAGAYQILARFYDVYKVQLKLPDFGPDSQRRIAVQMIRECGATTLIEQGRAADAMTACASRWASLPAAKFGQHVNEVGPLLAAYSAAGGALA